MHAIIILLIAIFCGSSEAAITLIANTSCHGLDGCTTPAVVTTGATLIVVAACSYTHTFTLTLSDSKSNSYTKRSQYSSNGSDGSNVQLAYSAAPTVGAGHTFTFAGTGSASSFFVSAYSGTLTASPFDLDAGAGDNGISATIQPGTITPSLNNEVVVTVVSSGFVTETNLTVDSGFTRTDNEAYVGGTSIAGAMAYKIQTTAAAVNPTWTSGSAVAQLAATQASFKAAVATGVKHRGRTF